jgi:hypothetical protein
MAWENLKRHALRVLEDWDICKTHKEGMRHKHKTVLTNLEGKYHF